MDSTANELFDEDQESLGDIYLYRVGDDVVAELLQVQETVHEQIRIDRPFTEINRQISKLSTIRLLNRYLSVTTIVKGQPLF